MTSNIIHTVVVVVIFIIAIFIAAMQWVIVNLAKRSVDIDWYHLATILVMVDLLLWHQGW